MKKLMSLILAGGIMLSGCSSQPVDSGAESGTNEYTIFPTTEAAFIGDTMPFYENGKMNIFYLADQRDGKTGYHPWALLSTEDYLTYEDSGVVIPYGDSAEKQDNALGTGCVMKDKAGLYHAFYTGHNDYYDPKEAIMHATSSDMINWTKIPEDTFTAGDNYSTTDFRDPYVFWVEEDQCYWMLVVTRNAGGGIIVKYTSTDLSKWEDGGIFFEDDLGYGTNMECPSVLEYKGKWYLAFSDQWPDRVVHYRISDSLKGEFKKPETEIFDGNGFYAGRLEKDEENLYLVGWNGTKVSHDDYKDYDWAGNMVVHQLEQQEDGTLKPIVNKNYIEKISNKLALNPVTMTNTVKQEGNAYQFSGKEYELVQFNMLDGSNRFETDITNFSDQASFGIAFAPDIDNVPCLNYVFNVKENRVEFYNTEKIFEEDAESYVDFDFSGKDKIHVTMLAYGGVVTLFIDGEMALTARMYRAQSSNWQLFGLNSGVKFENMELYY